MFNWQENNCSHQLHIKPKRATVHMDKNTDNSKGLIYFLEMGIYICHLKISYHVLP